MKVSGVLSVGGVLLLLLLAGCSRSDADEVVAQTAAAGSFFPCREPRPEICYEVFAPVCASLGGSGMQETYANDCQACADPQVSGYVAGACQ